MMTFTAVCCIMLRGLGLAVVTVVHLLCQLFLALSSPIACFYSWACYVIRCRWPGFGFMIAYINFFLSVLKSSHGWTTSSWKLRRKCLVLVVGVALMRLQLFFRQKEILLISPTLPSAPSMGWRGHFCLKMKTASSQLLMRWFNCGRTSKDWGKRFCTKS